MSCITVLCSLAVISGIGAIPIPPQSTLAGEQASFPMHQPLSAEMIYYINHVAKTSWRAGPTKRFESVSDIKRQLGALQEYAGRKLPINDPLLYGSSAIPESFDAREKWPNCPTIKEIRDQGDCGSNWAMGAVETMSDRICIHSNGKVNAHLAAQDLVSCCGFYCGLGCNGGFVAGAWFYYATSGIVTGGQYGSGQGCLGYEEPKCDHYNTKSLPPCKGEDYTPPCRRVCDSEDYNKTYSEDKHYGKPAYSISSNVSRIQTEIMTNGPVQAECTAYADFPSYKSGVYRRTSGIPVGHLAIKILGWGIEDGTPYWLAANSWNTDWGDRGFFKILRGQNECGIESKITAGLPRL